jgi:hypothetical protein
MITLPKRTEPPWLDVTTIRKTPLKTVILTYFARENAYAAEVGRRQASERTALKLRERPLQFTEIGYAALLGTRVRIDAIHVVPRKCREA